MILSMNREQLSHFFVSIHFLDNILSNLPHMFDDKFRLLYFQISKSITVERKIKRML